MPASPVSMPFYRSWPSGTAHDLRNPEISRIKTRDVIHHLVRIPRYNGGCRRHYSVAEHAIRVALWTVRHPAGGKQYAYAAVTHDAHEAFVGDQTAPLLAELPVLEQLCTLWSSNCDLALGVPLKARMCDVIKRIDSAIREFEYRYLIGAETPDSDELSDPSEWHYAERELRNLGVLARPSFLFCTATYSQLEALFARCLETFRGWQT